MLVLHCGQSGKKALERMAELGYRLPDEIRTLELPCTGRVNEVALLEALQDGMAGVVVVGCRKDNCKFLDGNLRAEKQVNRVKRILEEAKIQDKMVEMIFIAPDEGQKLYETLHDLLVKESV